LEALARADQRLLNSERVGANLSDLVRVELEPFASQVKVEGSDVTLNPSAAQNFALALHELATNASKYGALSVPHGMATVGWVITTDHNGGTLVFRWQERGGPRVSVPSRAGFGTSLLKVVLGEARFEYASDGFRLDAQVPLATITMRERPLGDESPAAKLDRSATSDERQWQGLADPLAEEGIAQLSLFDEGNVRASRAVPIAEKAVVAVNSLPAKPPTP
jgi:hypothetical protein